MKLSRRFFAFMIAAVLLISAIPMRVSAKGDIAYGIGFTTGSGLRLRSEPGTDSKIVTSAPKGEVLLVISKVGDWYKVIYNLKEGYMHSDYVSVLTRENAELGYGKINGTNVNLRSGPGTNYRILTQGSNGDKAYIIGINSGWYKVIFNGKICYIRSDYLDLTEIPYENATSRKDPIFFRNGKSTGVAPSASALPEAPAEEKPAAPEKPAEPEKNESAPVTGSAAGQQILNKAKQYLGIPYVYGGASPAGFDCSGLVYYVLRSLGYSSYRTPADQYRQGTYVAKSDLQPGDIVFFAGTYGSGISHVGIYAGEGKFIHSPNSRSVVSYGNLNDSYWVNHYYGARRMA